MSQLMTMVTNVSDEGFETNSCFAIVTEQKTTLYFKANVNFIHTLRYLLYLYPITLYRSQCRKCMYKKYPKPLTSIH